ncbi:MAG TPA: Gfo/Idh/MocA family oxidoreductase [Solirubrobacteraceae bacterium]|nr:Gfo/Idh/MocA family oxidoreductase [Solirubrobacteraceae bacterium]
MGAVGWGLLSTARINGALIAGAKDSELADVVAVASRDDERARSYAEMFGIPRAHGSYEALLADPEVEAVYVSLPNGLHVEWTIRALEAGKHVLCEKPMDRRPAAVQRAFDVAEREGLVLSEAFMWRHHPQTRRLRELLAEGAVGDVRLVRACFSFGLPEGETENVRLDAALDGGALMDVGCYCVSAARLVAGEPVSVIGERVTGSSGVDLRFAGMLRFDGDAVATFDCGIDVAPRHELEIVGSRGRMVLADPFHCRRPGIALERDGESSFMSVTSADSYRLEVEDVSRAIRGDGGPLLGRDDALAQARAIAALERSAEEGCAVDLR